MLGPNPKKAATPSTSTLLTSSSDSITQNTQGDGLMVKAIDDIFKFVEQSENPEEFRVSLMGMNKTCFEHLALKFIPEILNRKLF